MWVVFEFECNWKAKCSFFISQLNDLANQLKIITEYWLSCLKTCQRQRREEQVKSSVSSLLSIVKGKVIIEIDKVIYFTSCNLNLRTWNYARAPYIPKPIKLTIFKTLHDICGQTWNTFCGLQTLFNHQICVVDVHLQAIPYHLVQGNSLIKVTMHTKDLVTFMTLSINAANILLLL